MNPAAHLEGHIPPDSPLSVQRSLRALPKLVHPLTVYAVEDEWERDTRRLPAVLGAGRRRVRAFAERELMPRALALDTAPHLPPGEAGPETRDVLRLAGRAGLLTDLLPRPLGSGPLRGSRFPLVWYQVVRIEELARACGGLMLLLSAHALGVAPIVLSGDIGAIRRFLLPAFRRTEAGDPQLFAYAMTEPGTGSDWIGTPLVTEHHPGMVARPAGTGWSLTGRKVFISGGDLAARLCLFATLAGEGAESLTCFMITPGMPGFRVARTELKMGMRASGAAELELEDVQVSGDHVIGGLRRGWSLHRATMNASRIPVAGMAIGLARAATEAAIEFACRMRLAGKELIQYQEIQLMIAQMIAETTAMRGLVWSIAAKSFAPRDDEAAICKFYATDAAVRVCETAMDLLGNHAMLHGHRIEKTYRDARLTQIFEGTNQINRLAVIGDRQEGFLAEIARQRHAP